MFVPLTCLLAGFTLVYAGIRGGSETIDGVEVWRAPWLVILAPLKGGTLEKVDVVGLTENNGVSTPATVSTTLNVNNPVNALVTSVSQLRGRVQSAAKTSTSYSA